MQLYDLIRLPAARFLNAKMAVGYSARLMYEKETDIDVLRQMVQFMAQRLNGARR